MAQKFGQPRVERKRGSRRWEPLAISGEGRSVLADQQAVRRAAYGSGSMVSPLGRVNVAVIPTVTPWAANHPWFTSIAYRISPALNAPTTVVLFGVMSARKMTFLLASRNAMDSGIGVSFIQKPRCRSSAKTKSIPLSAAIVVTPISPFVRAAFVAAMATVRVAPFNVTVFGAVGGTQHTMGPSPPEQATSDLALAAAGRAVAQKASQALVGLSFQRLQAIVVDDRGNLQVQTGGRAVSAMTLPGADKDLVWLALKLALAEQALAAGKVVATVDDAFAGLSDGARRFAARLLKQIAKPGQIVHATSDPSFKEAADHAA